MRKFSQWVIGFSTVVICSHAFGQVTRRVSLSSAGIPGNGRSSYCSISADGRWVVFGSAASNLFPGDSNGVEDVFVHDRQTGTTDVVDVASNGDLANAGAWILFASPISADGRFVVFSSTATNLVQGDVNGLPDVFLRDRQLGTTELVSIGPGGIQADGGNWSPSISADGRFIAFESYATNLVPGDTGGQQQLYVRDRELGAMECVTVAPDASFGDGFSKDPILSPDGRYVAFSSFAANLVPDDTNGVEDVFLRDREAGTTELVSLSRFGVQGNDGSWWPRMSADARFVVFTTSASNFDSSQWPPAFDVVLRDRQNATTELISVNTHGQPANSHSSFGTISDDGRYVSFSSMATDLLPIFVDTNNAEDIFLRDRIAGTTQRVGVSSGGAQSNGGSQSPRITGDGRAIVFNSVATNLVPNDVNAQVDVFVREWQDGTAITNFTSLCSPGLDGVVGCPCSNPPAGPDRGCDNSASTGGASLTASGNTSLTADGLVFTVTGERLNDLSVLVQGNALVSGGRVYGQGVRCLGGTLRRICWTVPDDATFSFPNLRGGDIPVSVRSASRNGDQILPGESRWYVVFYRDANVLGGCPETSTFNSTQTGEILWSP